MDRSSSYPRAILHFDGDAFFASIEQSKDWRLKGKPVITGGERGAATSLSYEAKKLGLHRGMPMREIKRVCPQAVIVASDYTAYSIYARRMYAIVREFTDRVDEYSIDECFADITGLEDRFDMTYEEIGLAIQERLHTSLGITFGVGLASSKTLAKVASKRNKPAGFTPIPREKIDECLSDTEIYDVWGLGGVTGNRLRSLGVITALDYIRKPDAWLKENGFVKPQRDTWLELAGHAVMPFGGRAHETQSVMKTRTFTPPSEDREFIFAQLSKNIEAACAKLRRLRMKARAISFYLKTQEFTYHAVQIDLPVPLDSPSELLELARRRFHEVYATEIPYRASGVTLRSLVEDDAVTPDLFGVYAEKRVRSTAFGVLDTINSRYGRGTVYLGSSMQAHTAAETSYRKPKTVSFLRSGSRDAKSLDIPYLGTVR